MSEPMAPYLATATTGRFDLDVKRIGGRPVYTAVDPRERDGKRVLRRIPGMVRYFSKRFGRYPFDSIGAIVDHAPKVGYALETQSIPIFDEATGKLTLAHEIAHQWFGDAVTLRKWPQIWLHEGIAQWSEWAWRDHAGGLSLARTYRSLYSTPADKHSFWDPPPARVGTPANLFAPSVYQRGAIAVEALRREIGNRDLNEVLHRLYVRHRYGNSTIRQFIALAESVSGQDLDRFFDDWLYEPGKPRGYGPKKGARGASAPHRREQQDFPNALRPGEDHHQPVDAEPDP
jgi:aminopeptidase N